jgi:hypothetical protein
MKSSVIRHSVVFNGHKTSVSLEDEFWNSLKEIAHAHGVTTSKLVAEIDNAPARQPFFSGPVVRIGSSPADARSGCTLGQLSVLRYLHHGLGVGGHLVCPQTKGTARFSRIKIRPTSCPLALSVPQRRP